MKVQLITISIILFLISCGNSEAECNCPECPESFNEIIEKPALDRPESFDKTSEIVININLDTNYIMKLESNNLLKYNAFPGFVNDTGQEGYPYILNNLDYFLVEKWSLSEDVNIDLVFGEIPKDTIQNQVDYYRALYLVSYDEDGEHVDTEVVGKRMITSLTGGLYQSVFTKIVDNGLTISSHNNWYSASGRYYSEWTDNYYVITNKGRIMERMKLLNL
jgi:hypothetical protein